MFVCVWLASRVLGLKGWFVVVGVGCGCSRGWWVAAAWVVLVWCGCVVVCPGVARAACPDEGARGKQVRGVDLPDCREYEQVSPVDKGGVDAEGFPGSVEASLSGGRVSYYSITPFPEACALEGGFPTYISSLSGGGVWGTEGVFPCEAPEAEDLGVSEDLSEMEVQVFGSLLTAQALPGRNFYVRYTEPSGGERYRWLAHTAAGAGTEEFELWFAGFSADDQHLLVETEEPLTEGAVADAPNVFEADLDKPVDEQWSLIGMIPPAGHETCEGPACVVSPGGAVAGLGAYNWPTVHEGRHYTQSAISQDGSRVFFTALPSGRLFVREDGQSTAAVSAGAAHFRMATPDGVFVFYTEGEDLYRYDTLTQVRETIVAPVTAMGSGDVSENSTEITGVVVSKGVFRVGEEIFGTGLKRGTRVTAVGAHSLTLSFGAAESVSDDALTGSPAGVVGVLGGPADGSAVYFVAGGVLAGDTREYEYVNAKGEHEKASETAGSEPKVVNLYEWYLPSSGPAVVTFIARLDTGSEGDGDEEDWKDYLGLDFPTVERLSRVTGDGGTVLFASVRSLTGYGNSGPCVGPAGGCSEFFRYRAGVEGGLGRLTCVSCNPDRAVGPLGDALLEGEGGGVRGSAGAWLSRNLSANGNRVFFQTQDALVADDTDPGTDVYEWEADGEGSCVSDVQDEGCLFLISSGESEPAYFGDASADGSDVFFFTRQALASTDVDSNVDVYDARVCLKGEACEELPRVGAAECGGEGCVSPAPVAPPGPVNLGSASVGGSGNLPEAPSAGLTSKPKPSVKQELAAALKACRAKHDRHRRRVCEARARKRYPVKAASHKKEKRA